MNPTARVHLIEGEKLRLGRVTSVVVTDVDPSGVRIVAEGQYLGGPDDGAPFRFARELVPGSRVEFGPRAALVLLQVQGKRATFLLDAPAYFPPSIET